MLPAFHLGGYLVFTYPVMQLASVGTAAAWLHLRRKPLGLADSVALDAALVGLLAVLVGGRLEWLRAGGAAATDGEWWRHVGSGGFSFFGVLVFLVIGTALYARLQRRPVLGLWDLMVPALPLAVAVYRVGCFAAGCCYGLPSSLPWAVTFPAGEHAYAPAGVPLHPTQLYEAALALGIFAGLLILQRREHRPGDLTLIFLAGWCALRFGTEFLRGDPHRGWFLEGLIGERLSEPQGLSLIALLVTCVAWLARRRGRQPTTP